MAAPPAADALRESEARYRDIVEHLSDLVCIHDLDGRLTFVNRAAIELLGYAPQEILGHNVRELLAPEAAGEFDAYLARVRAEGQATGLMRVRTRAGESRIWEYRNLLRTPPGAEPFVLGVARDVSRELRIERALRRSEQKFATLFAKSAFPAVLASVPEGRVVEVNEAFVRAFGYSREEALGRTSIELGLRADTPARDAMVADLLETRSLRGVEVPLRTRDGEMRTVIANLDLVAIDGQEHILGTAQDVTEARRAEAEAREMRQRLELAARAGNVGLWDWDIATGRVYYSPEWKRQLGHAPHEIADRFEEWQSRVHPQDLPGVLETVHAYLAKPWPDYRVEFRMRHRDGSWRWILSQGDLLRDPDGTPRRMLGSHIDITERKLAEAALRERERQLSTLIGNLPGVVYRCRNDERYTTEYISEGALAVTGYPARDFLEHRREIGDLIEPQDRAAVHEAIEAALRDGGPYEITYRLRDAGGAQRWIWERGSGILDPAGKLQALEGFATDVTQRMRGEEELRALSRGLSRAQEDERRLIARGLHDDIGQALTAVRLNLQAVRRARSAAERRRALEDSLSVTDEAIEHVRSMSLELRPPALDDLGLGAALGWYCRRAAERAGIPVTLGADAKAAAEKGPRAVASYRIAQEAITNALRHARARRVRVTLRRRDGRLVLQVADDGAGFEARATGRTALGLLGMRERAELAGGKLRIESMPGKGTRVRAEFAVERA